jgi:hypothetical protein
MKSTIARDLLTIFLLLIYINRGFFISDACEMNNPDGEINSIAEFIAQLITGESNDIDEDGDLQTGCYFVKLLQPDFSQQLAQSIQLASLFYKEIKMTFPVTENLPPIDFYARIEQPPEIS